MTPTVAQLAKIAELVKRRPRDGWAPIRVHLVADQPVFYNSPIRSDEFPAFDLIPVPTRLADGTASFVWMYSGLVDLGSIERPADAGPGPGQERIDLLGGR